MIDILKVLVNNINVELFDKSKKNILFEIKDNSHTFQYWLRFKDQIEIYEGIPSNADIIIKGEKEVFKSIANGDITYPSFLIQNLLTIEGNGDAFSFVKKLFKPSNAIDIWSAKKIIETQNELLKTEEMTRNEIIKMQREKLDKLIRYAIGNSDFYRNLYKDIDLDNYTLESLPVINKKMVMQNFDKIITDKRLKLEEIYPYIYDTNSEEKFYKDEFIATTSSATTGIPGVFVYNKDSWLLSILSQHRSSRQRMKNRTVIPKMALVSTTSITASSHNSVRLYPTHIMQTKTFSMIDSIEDIVSGLNEYQPHILTGYPTALYSLALEQQSGKLNIRPWWINTFGEQLGYMRTTIEKAFGSEIFDTYQTTETMNIAWECEQHQGLHINSDLVIIESVDKDNKPVKDGEIGEKVLVTNLFNYTQPLIRYELYDIISLSKKECLCGSPFPVIERLEGRVEDFLTLLSGERIIKLNPLTVAAIMNEIRGVNMWQFVQSDFKHVLINIVTVEPQYADLFKECFINKVLKPNNIDEGTIVEIKNVSSIKPINSSGKIQSFINYINREGVKV
ncbi:phenylacetate--CoA ligase family protein [Ruminiclostridium cellulolyticum]|uniref:Coenzyme F390 synthetase-like protein n=1 Tax=Ruminiclostridium cellulolyticum (strain ATCC 35319 / DSM 5812 / JCM 6584 / H10) TaxID=394503 RepID=B8I8L4_RUMCH|nr:SCP2 sterol-binding domain-containing protein [Ruminiclostridium cellulolyticum]ACL75247.1 Coenzyme F390 synthetase-like protein [Ruminiclostridium cellulolyticum H10]